jgi:hypothetical protein
MNNDSGLNVIIVLLVAILFVVGGVRLETIFNNIITMGLWCLAAWAAFCGIRGIVRGIAKASVALGIHKAAAILFAAICSLPAWTLWFIPAGCIVAGLVLDIEWLWFWPGVIGAVAAYPSLDALANKLPYLRKDQ